MTHGRRHGKPKSLEDRYLSELGQGGERDDMLQALCRIADELKRSNEGSNTNGE